MISELRSPVKTVETKACSVFLVRTMWQHLNNASGNADGVYAQLKEITPGISIVTSNLLMLLVLGFN